MDKKVLLRVLITSLYVIVFMRFRDLGREQA